MKVLLRIIQCAGYDQRVHQICSAISLDAWERRRDLDDSTTVHICWKCSSSCGKGVKPTVRSSNFAALLTEQMFTPFLNKMELSQKEKKSLQKEIQTRIDSSQKKIYTRIELPQKEIKSSQKEDQTLVESSQEEIKHVSR